MGEVTISDNVQGNNCAHCGKQIMAGEQAYVCDNCGEPYHLKCWNDNGGCKHKSCRNMSAVAESIASAQSGLPPYQDATSDEIAGSALADEENINDHLTEAILATLCCCVPFGIVAIVYASKAKAHRESQDYIRAREDANTAQQWVWASIIGGLLAVLLRVLSVVLQ